jgi:sugar/nucleoside kinase (ribokinase family)
LGDLCETVVVTTNKEGCWIADGEKQSHYPAYPVKPLDSTGAGDLFAAGFLHGYLTKKPLSLCAEYGARIAAEVVKVLGAEIPGEVWTKLSAEINNY